MVDKIIKDLRKIKNMIRNKYIVSYHKIVHNADIHIGKNTFLRKSCKLYIEKGAILLIGDNTAISEDSKLIVHSNSKLIIGSNVFVSNNTIISSNSEVFIGDYSIIAHFVTILDTNHNYLDPNIKIRYQGGTSKKIFISQDTWIGAGAVILCGVKIGTHSVIAANAVVNREVPDYVVVGGVPARIIKRIE